MCPRTSLLTTYSHTGAQQRAQKAAVRAADLVHGRQARYAVYLLYWYTSAHTGAYVEAEEANDNVQNVC
jgi:hypothetical protein